MRLWDYHTHNILCNHAIGTIEEYVWEASKQNMLEIGISDHFPMYLLPKPFSYYAMSMDELPKYIKEVRRLQKKYNKPKIKLACEVDYYPSVFTKYKNLIKPFIDEFDYIIGSVHAVDLSPNNGYITIDETQSISDIIHVGIDRFYLMYYDSVLKMVMSGFYNILGHLDIPNRFGLTPNDPDTIYEKIFDILDVVRSSDMAIEVNTSGFRKLTKEQYPSDFLLTEIINREIPLTLGSDAHKPVDVGFNFDTILQKIKQRGLKYLCKFKKQEKQLIFIS